MSNQPPPPKPKPGSLRDRIAAFENKPASTPADRPAPAPRPKPGGLAWKPRAPSPSSPPKASASSPERSHVPERKPIGGMSASDAKESIGLGGSLKERMAALQGKGAFGGIPSAATVPPKPVAEKPKWKPPPVVSPSAEGDAPASDTHQSDKSPPPVAQQSVEDEIHKAESTDEPTSAPEGGGEEAEQPDTEEEERQRRAAIAARMARLGGARVGMSPPVFGRKPSMKKTETPKDEEAPTVESQDVVSPSDHPPLKSPQAEGISEVAASDKVETEASTDYFASAPPRQDSASSSLLSADSVSQSSKSPSSMPIPSVPRRAAPPRKKAIKSHSGTPIVSKSQEDISEQPLNTNNDAVPALANEILDKQQEAEGQQIEGTHEAVKSPIMSEGHQVTESPAQIEGGDAQPSDAEMEAGDDHGTREPEIYIGEPGETQEDSSDTSAVAEKETTSAGPTPIETEVEAHTTVEPIRLAAEQEEEDEAARRKRVAEKLAKMGGINPFAPRPPATSLPADSRIETQDNTNPEDLSVGSASPPTENSEQSVTALAHIHEPATLETVSPPLESPPKIEDVKTGIEPEPVSPEDHEDDLSLPLSHHSSEAFEEEGHEDEVEGDEFDHEILGRYKFHEGPQGEQLSHIYEKTGGPLTNEESNEQKESYSHSEDYDEDERAPPRINRPIPPPPVPNMSSRPDLPHQRSTSQGSIRPLPQPPRIAPTTIPLPETEIEDQGYLQTPRPYYRPIPPVPLPVDDELAAIEEPLEEQTPLPSLRRLPFPPRRQSGTQTTVSPISPTQKYDTIPPDSPASLIRPERASSSPAPTPPTRPVPHALRLEDKREREILDEDEGDPIDPSFQRYSKVPPSLPTFGSYEISHVDRYPSSSPTSHTLSNRRSLSPPNSSSPSSGASITPPFQFNFPEGPIAQDHPEHSYHRNRRDAEFSLPVTLAASETPQTILEQALVPQVEEEDAEQSRRQTIAERMAKLGGIKFGTAPPIGRTPPNVARVDAFSEQSESPSQENHLQEVQLTGEEEERARKQRIASKLAGMGGVGMFGAPQRAPSQPPNRRRESDEITTTIPLPPALQPQRAAPPSRVAPAPQRRDSDFDADNFEDGAQVETDSGALKEINPEHVMEQEVPPPVPSRGGRRLSGTRFAESATSSPPRKTTLSPRRPPIPSVPANVVNRRSSLRKSSADYTPPTSRMSSFDISRASPVPQTEYVMVEEPESIGSEDVTRPPSGPSRGPPSRPAPSPNNENNTSGWEMPSIPTSLTFDGPQLDLSLSSWSDDSTSYPTAQESHPSPAQQEVRRTSNQMQPKPTVDVQLSSEELMAAWGKVGVQLCESATTMFERSKKSHIGDGSYRGFVLVVFSQVPNARPPSESGYGYLIYAQSGSAVQRRVCDIMPGDVVALFDVKLKGHKGLQLYNQHVGAAEPLVGIVSDFEPKKSKIKVFHANQHVGQQTVESVSYRLEDIKSGTVKIFRALEA